MTRRYSRAMHRAIRRYRQRLIVQGLRFVDADDPEYIHLNGWAYAKGQPWEPTTETTDAVRYFHDGLATLPPREP